MLANNAPYGNCQLAHQPEVTKQICQINGSHADIIAFN